MKVPVSTPFLGDLEKFYVNKALDAAAVSGVYGEFIERFEESFAKFCDTKYAVTCSNGTTALHLAMVAGGIRAGDEVLVSTLTNMATFFAVLYIGAIPIPIDIDPLTLTMSPLDLKSKITKKSRGVMVVHLFGQATDMDAINDIANEHDLIVFEDCAEAHGALYKNRKVGSLSSAGAFSFFANKLISTGEGGMVVTDDIKIAEKARSLKALAFGSCNKFMHDDLGYNYRMTNVQAAIGCGQMEQVEFLINRRIEIAAFYEKALKKYSEHIILPFENKLNKNVYWMYHIILKPHLIVSRASIRKKLSDLGVETREGFIPFHLQDKFLKEGMVNPDDCPNATKVDYASFYLPSGPVISDKEQNYVVESVCTVLNEILFSLNY